MAAPTIVNSNINGASNPPQSDHGRKPSVTITAAGTTGQLPNGGGPVPSSNRPAIHFGSTSPAIANSVPYQSQTASLPTPPSNPRITSPAHSPSPIPQPGSSGGRPPSSLHGQGNVMSFGSMPGPAGMEADANRAALRNVPPQGPAAGIPPQHLRRESSQSMHGDMSGSPGMQYGNMQHPRGGFNPGQGGRGRGYPNYGQPMSNSPSTPYRQVSGQRPGSNLPPHLQNPMSPYQNAPHQQPRSPAMGGAHPVAPQMQGAPMNQQPMPYHHPSFSNFQQQLSHQPNQYMQNPYDPNLAYYQAPYNVPPQYLPQQTIPGSPRQFNKNMHPVVQQPYGPGQFNHPPSQNMSRTSSQLSERPASSLGAPHPHPPPSSTPSVQSAHGHSQSIGGAPSAAGSANSNFSIPSRAKKGIVIKNADGEVVTFDKKTATPSPGTASGAPTPPPPSQTPSNASLHTRSDSKTGKSAEEIKAEFLANVKKGQEAGKQIKEDDREDAATATSSEAVATKDESKESAVSETAASSQEPVATGPSQTPEEKTPSVEAVAAAPADTPQKGEPEPPSGAENSQLDEEERLRLEEEERMIAEMEAAEREEEERERAFQEKKKKDAADRAAREKEAAANADAEMRRLEREAEEAEEARQKEKKADDEETDEARAEREKMFASLKKSTLGPGAQTSNGADTPESGQSTPPQQAPAAEAATATAAAATQPSAPAPAQRVASGATKPRPAALKIDPTKAIEPAQPTAGMQSLKSARMLQIQSEAISYPGGIKSPNPALIQGGKRNGRVYDKDFLMQFQDVFKEKPSVDWDQRLKDTIGDGSETPTPKSGRPSAGADRLGSRTPSVRGSQPTPFTQMGSIGQTPNRQMPPGGVNLAQFNASGRPPMTNPLANFGGRPTPFPVGGMSMGRTPSLQSNRASPRTQTSQRGPKDSRRDDRAPSKKEQEALNAKMPLTAKEGVKELEVTKNGWKPLSVTKPAVAAASTNANGAMPPDMVQRKVKAALNKMTPERFEKISDQILEIAAQSKDELDGRTLRQVIQLTFEKATDEAHWASMYAKFCLRMLETMSDEVKDENVRSKDGQIVTGGTLFRKYLLNRCQEEFERGWDFNLPEKEEGQTEEAAMLSDEYYKAAAAKRRGLGLIQFIGELYKLKMLSIRIMHQCFLKLLNFEGIPDELAIESLVKLLRTVGATMEASDNGPAMVATYMERAEKIMNMQGLPSRMYWMLMDVVDLRKEGWHSKDDTKGPKTIQEIHHEAAVAQHQAELEKQKQNQRGGGRPPAGRGDARNFSGGMMPPPDYARNQADTADLRKLGQRSASRQIGAGGPSKALGPSSMLSSRSASGRQGLGPSTLMTRENSSRSGSQRGNNIKKDNDEPTSATNAFSALASLDGSGDGTDKTPISSPSLARVNPATPSSSGDAAANNNTQAAAATATTTGGTPGGDSQSASTAESS